MNNRVYVLTLEEYGEGNYYTIVEVFNRREDAIARMVEECNNNQDFIAALHNEAEVTIDKERGYASSDPNGFNEYYSYYNVESVEVKGKNFEFDKVVITKIPRDPRHNSKIDYDKLKKILS